MMIVRQLPILTVWAVLAPCCAQGDGRDLPDGPQIRYEDAFPRQEPFPQPLLVEFTPADPEHAYVVCQPGQVFRVPRDPERSDRELFCDLSDRIYPADQKRNWEEGLLGFQFDPDYADNHHVFCYWSEQIEPRKEPMARGRRKSNRQSVIARYTVVEREGRPVVDPASELRVLEQFQPFGNHNAGTILFGPDGMLYIAFGDGGAANDPYGNAESLQMLLGKVLRIDVRNATRERPYRIPEDNPFVGREEARGEIWCYGLRNVWRMSFDRETNELWAGDVGQNRIEEVDVLVKGGFYGWNSYEGNEEFGQRNSKLPTPPDHIPPVATYSHRKGLSITGGHVYRGQRIPALRGYYVYSDFITKRAWACRRGENQGPAEVVKLRPAPFPPSSYAEEPDGELLMTCFLGKQGKVYRLVPAED